MRRVRPLRHRATAVVLAALGAACVHIKAPSFPTFGPGEGDTASFVVDGGLTTVTQSGSITVSGTGTPLDYSGPLGCDGRYFDADSTDDVSMDFRYSGEDAFLLIGSDLYYFGEPPKVIADKLRWQGEFPGRTISVTVGCPFPESTERLSPAPAG